MDQQLKKLMKELGEAINESLSDSEQIADVVSKIKAGGYDIFLVLEATIGFNKREDEAPATKPATIGAAADGSDPQFSINSQDLKFLKSLRISVEDAP